MREKIEQLLREVSPKDADITVTIPDVPTFGHYSTAIALKLAKAQGKQPREVAEALVKTLKEKSPEGFFEKIEIAGAGFINFWLSKETLLKEFSKMVENDTQPVSFLRGKRILVEYTDPNPFKEFHIGHLMTNTIGESLARVLEGAGAEVLRVNYQGDVGLHVAKSIWGILKLNDEMPKESVLLSERVKFLGRAYTEGAKAYEENDILKKEIEEINKKVYERSESQINNLYDTGRKWSLDYFETIYAKLGTKFAHYFFESEVASEGLEIVKAYPGVFKKSQGAVIFPGEEYGLHNRVFINSAGLPTYETKELGLNKKKFDLYSPDLSLIVTGNEVNDYFNVLLKAMSMILPEIALKTKHIGHGMLRLTTGKMSSRTGNVLTAESLIDEIKQAVGEKLKDREGLGEKDREEIKEKVAIAAIRYSILKQGIGSDVVFDKEKSVAFQGDSGPYLQYTYARLRKIVSRAETRGVADFTILESQEELSLIKKLIDFPDEISHSAKELVINNITKYLIDLAGLASHYYESTPILKDENELRRNTRLEFVEFIAKTLQYGLWFLGIETLEMI